MGNKRIILFQIYYFPGHNDGGAPTLPPMSCHSNLNPVKLKNKYSGMHATFYLTIYKCLFRFSSFNVGRNYENVIF